MAASVVATELHKAYGSTVALGRVSFAVEPGELFGFVGPDGAGKTTLFRILVSLVVPDGGEARVDGLDPVRQYRELRRRLGYMPGRFSLYQDLSVEENLRFFATIFGTTIEAGYDLIREIYAQIEPFRDRRAGALSGGMKQKLALSCALVHRPKVLFLDEPTTGVDAVSRREFWDMLSRLRAEGITIVVSTPYMDEATRCDRVALIQEGSLLGVDTPAAIAASFDRPLLVVRTPRRLDALRVLRSYEHARSAWSFGEDLHYADTRDRVEPAEIARLLAGAGIPDAVVRPATAGIEDVFMDRMHGTAAPGAAA